MLWLMVHVNFHGLCANQTNGMNFTGYTIWSTTAHRLLGRPPPVLPRRVTILRPSRRLPHRCAVHPHPAGGALALPNFDGEQKELIKKLVNFRILRLR